MTLVGTISAIGRRVAISGCERTFYQSSVREHRCEKAELWKEGRKGGA